MSDRDEHRRSNSRTDDDVSAAVRRVEESLEKLSRVVRDDVKQGFSRETAGAFHSTADGIDRATRRFRRHSSRRSRRREERRERNRGWESFERPRLRRSVENRMLAGVCAGLAEYWGIETWVARVGTIVAAMFLPHLAIAAYVVAWILLPRSDDPKRRRSRRRPDISSHEPVAPELGGRHAWRRSLRTLQRAFDEIDRRIRNMEATVTDRSFSVRREFGKLGE